MTKQHDIFLFDHSVQDFLDFDFYDSTSKVSFNIYDHNTDRTDVWNIASRILILKEKFRTPKDFLDSIREVEVGISVKDIFRNLLTSKINQEFIPDFSEP